jgi:hypothetical protein
MNLIGLEQMFASPMVPKQRQLDQRRINRIEQRNTTADCALNLDLISTLLGLDGTSIYKAMALSVT